MRRIVFLLAVLALASASPKEYDDKTECVSIEGAWELIEWEGLGVVCTTDKSTRTYHGGTYINTKGNSETDRGSYRFNQAIKPPHLDYVPACGQRKGETIRCIYRIEGNILKVARMPAKQDAPRPHGFDDIDVVIFTYKRVGNSP
jgi:uncharacterized protein (TIGR03067 family)